VLFLRLRLVLTDPIHWNHIHRQCRLSLITKYADRQLPHAQCSSLGYAVGSIYRSYHPNITDPHHCSPWPMHSLSHPAILYEYHPFPDCFQRPQKLSGISVEMPVPPYQDQIPVQLQSTYFVPLRGLRDVCPDDRGNRRH